MSKNVEAAESDLNDLEFVKLKLPRLIPYHLIDSVKGRTFTPEEFYQYQEIQIKNENPLNYLFALVDKHKKILGYLWAEINMLDGSLFVNTFSIDKAYWHKGKAIPKVIEFLKTLKKRADASRVFWISTNQKFFSKHGFRPSKNVLMEYNLD